MKIAIIDGLSQDIGLKLLFPEADYFIYKVEEGLEEERNKSNTHYNITPSQDWSSINDNNYDFLFIILSTYDTYPNTRFYKHETFIIYEKIMKIINENNFKKICIFDNYDYDYDPNDYITNDKVTVYFKRNYNLNKVYNKNVVPFPFIMFGYVSLIEKIDRELVSDMNEYCKPKVDRVFFTGSLFVHDDPEYGLFRDRRTTYYQLRHHIHDPGSLRYEAFMSELRNSKFGLDLLGVGEPNKRTIEILISGALLLSQRNHLVWGFEEGDELCQETVFDGAEDFTIKLSNLRTDESLYNRCLQQQYRIVKKYFNKEWLVNYIHHVVCKL
jgi:hypothetical protein